MASPGVYMQVGSQQKVDATKVSVPQTVQDMYNASSYRKTVEGQRTTITDLVHENDKLKTIIENNNAETDNENHTQTPARSWCTIT